MYGRLSHKYVRITMDDGSIWSIAADQIAENRARAWAMWYKKPLEEARLYVEELFEDDDKIINWLCDYMTFEEAEDKMFRIKEPSPQGLKEMYEDAIDFNRSDIEIYDKWPELRSEGSED